MDEPVNSLIGEKLGAYVEVNRKTNRPNRPATPFHSIFQAREPYYIQLDPIYYDFSFTLAGLATFYKASTI